MVIFGGINSAGQKLGDVWELRQRGFGDPTFVWKWIERTPAVTGPSNRAFHGAVFHTPATLSPYRRMYVFGGLDPTRSLDQALYFLELGDNSTVAATWGVCSNATTPPTARYGHVFVRESFTGPDSDGGLPLGQSTVWVFGGAGPQTDAPINDGIHIWKGVITIDSPTSTSVTWSQLTTTGDPAVSENGGRPMPRVFASGTFNYRRRQLWIHGGDTNGKETAGGQTGEFWSLAVDAGSGGIQQPQWKRISQATEAGARSGHVFRYDYRPSQALNAEVFNPADNSVTMFPGVLNQSTYPHMFLLPNDKLFWAGREAATRVYNPLVGWESTIYSSGPHNGDCSVMYLPGKILKSGDTFAEDARQSSTIDLTLGSPSWTLAPQDKKLFDPRRESNLTVLADGSVITTGGTEKEYPANPASRRIEFWNQESSDWEQWSQEPVDRDYHSAAILMPDGTVLSTGGDHPDSLGVSYRRYGTIFYPPYLFTHGTDAFAPRPVISAMDTLLTYGCNFKIELASGSAPNTCSKVSFIRPGAVTHAFNQEQRYMPLSFTTTIQSGKTLIQVTAPATPQEMPPGDYMVFVLNSSNVPSIARWVRLAPGGVRTGTTTAPEIWKAGEIRWVTGTGLIIGNYRLTIQSGSTVVFDGADASLRLDYAGSDLQCNGALLTGPATGDPHWGGVLVSRGKVAMTNTVLNNLTIFQHFNSDYPSFVNNCRLTNAPAVTFYINGGNFSAAYDTVECSTVTGTCGFAIFGGSPTVTRCRILGKDVPGSVGIYATRMATLLGNYISGFKNTSGATARGIMFEIPDSTITPIVDEYQGVPTEIRGCKEGIFSTSLSRPKVRRTRIDNSLYAVHVATNSKPDLGNTYEYGHNDMSVSGNGTKFVHTDPRVDDVQAVGNWWGTTNLSFIAGKMGMVTWQPILDSDPLVGYGAHRPDVVAVDDTGVRELGASPNPMSRAAVFTVRVPQAYEAETLTLEIFDVVGRLVRSIRLENESDDGLAIPWDGRSDSGAPVESGVYFCRLRGSRLRSEALRLVVAR
jgi:hypothetical protein